MHRHDGRIVISLILCVVLWCARPVLAQVSAAQRQTRATTGSATTTQRAGLRGDAIIQYDPESGSLIVITDEETNKHIRQVVENLDMPVPQVLIKVLFLEVTHSRGMDLGAEYFRQRTKTYDFSTQVDTETIESIFGNPATGLFYRIIQEDLEVTLHALSQVAKLEVLSRPSILTRNNKEAVITVGQEVPFIRNSRITQDGQTINTVEYEDIGIILRVTPYITEDRLVAMDVSPEISTLTGETVPISETVNAPVFAKRSAETSVVVPDGCTVVIGGLMEDNTTRDSGQVPFLGRIPILGAPFRRTQDSKRKTELLIFLTPHVVEKTDELDMITASEKRNTRLAPKAFSEKKLERFTVGSPAETNTDSAAPGSEAAPAKPARKGLKKLIFWRSRK